MGVASVFVGMGVEIIGSYSKGKKVKSEEESKKALSDKKEK